MQARDEFPVSAVSHHAMERLGSHDNLAGAFERPAGQARRRDDCPHAATPARVTWTEPDPSRIPDAEATSLRRRLAIAAVLSTATITLVLAVPPLRGVAGQIEAMNADWVLVALVAEVASCAGFVVVFRLFFAELPSGVAREVAWTEEASGALLPTGGVGALALGGWLLRQTGVPTQTIVRRSSGLFFLTSAANVTALIAGGLLLATGDAGEPSTLALAGIPLALGVFSTAVTLALPSARRRTPRLPWPAWLAPVADGIDDARGMLLHPSWRLLGAAAYLGCDIAALGAAFAATGHPIPIVGLVLGYVLGYVANMAPIPGGIGALEAGLAGTLIAYGAPAPEAAAAVVVYHAMAFWVPSLGGLFAYTRLRRRLDDPHTPTRTTHPALGAVDLVAEPVSS
jgi:uncharacterized membrane protein YbhN (UPF0104 family)